LQQENHSTRKQKQKASAMNYNNLFFISACIIGLCLMAIVAALIFSPKFRKDVLDVEGKTAVFKYFTVEGALILSLTALFLGSLIFLLTKMQFESWELSTTTKTDWVVLDKNTGQPVNLYINDSLIYKANKNDLQNIQLKLKKTQAGIFLSPALFPEIRFRKMETEQLAELGFFNHLEFEDNRDISRLFYKVSFSPLFQAELISNLPEKPPISISFVHDKKTGSVFYNLCDSNGKILNKRLGCFDEGRRMPETILLGSSVYFIELLRADFMDKKEKYAEFRIVELKPKIK
jgi:hypothetical protein